MSFPFVSEDLPDQLSSTLTNITTGDQESSSESPPKKRRVSHFKELGIDNFPQKRNIGSRPSRRVRFQSKSNVFEAPNFSTEDHGFTRTRQTPDYVVPLKAPAETALAESIPRSRMSSARFFTFAVIFTTFLALLHNSPLIGSAGDSTIGVQGGVVRGRSGPLRKDSVQLQALDKRQQQQYDPTNFCKRWSHQSAMVNGTIYIYGGQVTTDDQQTSNEWSNDFLYLDATQTWSITSPVYSSLPQPSGPPAVANGYLWHSYTSLFLYGGLYSDAPATSPSPVAVWEYDISGKNWIEHSKPSTSAGNNSDGGNQPVQNAAEGAGISVPSLGRGYLFGGHLDHYTTVDWSLDVARLYLKSLLEFTFPGASNAGLASSPAGQDGAFRNITTAGNQADKGFSERADGVLAYVPGFGQEGVILGLAGGNNVSFQEMNVIDVYDIATSEWYQQATSGSWPKMRVNPCAVAVSAPDGSSTNVYMFGGQNLQPFKNQTQLNDTWILSIPSFNWIEVDQTGQSVPPGRSGHSCEVWDGQMIVIGGYVGDEVQCEPNGVYVFDMTNLKWQNSFNSLSGADLQNQQSSQSNNPNALAGSYGYEVPGPVQSVIGGASMGGATLTAPVASATGGPLATGSPVIYTVTGSGGVLVTETARADAVPSSSSGPNVAAIVAGTIAGVLFLIACYLGFCTWVYRRQLQLYKNHVAASQRAAAAPPNEKTGFLGASIGRSSDDPSSRRSADVSSSNPSSQRFSNRTTTVPPVPSLPKETSQGRDSTANSSTDDLLTGQEPSFMGVLLNPRRSLRVVNRD